MNSYRGWAGSNTEGWKAYLTYISEGLGRSQDWEMAMKYQRKNGSLFNSPAATAAAFTHLNDTLCFDYLRSLVDKFGNDGWSIISILMVFLVKIIIMVFVLTSQILILHAKNISKLSVPTVHPFDVYARICMGDSVEKLGIDRHFKEEIQTVLDQAYR